MQKRLIQMGILLAIMALAATSVMADPQVRIAGNVAADFAQRPTLEDVRTGFDDQGEIFWGLHWEIITDRVGFGWHTLVKFDQVETGLKDPMYDWSLDWLGDFYVAYHFFGGGALVDPFLEVGFGNAGRVDIDDDGGTWTKVDGDWEYEVDEWDPTEESVMNLGLYPYIGGGVAFDLGGLLLGARVSYRPTVIPVPATQFEVYPLTNFQVAVFGGVALGGH